MNKKIFTIFVLVIVVASVSAVSAFDLGDLFGEKKSEEITIGGIKFNVPDGYTEIEGDYLNKTSAELSMPGYKADAKAFKKDSTEVVIVVGNYTNGTDKNLSELGNATTLASIEGYASDEEGTYLFSYDDKNNLVTFSTNDKNAISDFIKA